MFGFRISLKFSRISVLGIVLAHLAGTSACARTRTPPPNDGSGFATGGAPSGVDETRDPANVEPGKVPHPDLPKVPVVPPGTVVSPPPVPAPAPAPDPTENPNPVLPPTPITESPLHVSPQDPVSVPAPIVGAGDRLALAVSPSAETLFRDRSLFAHEDAAFRPASTAKVFTALTALADLGSEFRFHSTVDWKLGADGFAYDVMITGGGDPTWVFPSPDRNGNFTAAEIRKSPLAPLIEDFKRQHVNGVRGAIRFRSADAGLDRRGGVDASTARVRFPIGWNDADKRGEYLRRQDEFGVIPGSFYYPTTVSETDEWDDGDRFTFARFGCSDETPRGDQVAYRARFPERLRGLRPRISHG